MHGTPGRADITRSCAKSARPKAHSRGAVFTWPGTHGKRDGGMCSRNGHKRRTSRRTIFSGAAGVRGRKRCSAVGRRVRRITIRTSFFVASGPLGVCRMRVSATRSHARRSCSLNSMRIDSARPGAGGRPNSRRIAIGQAGRASCMMRCFFVRAGGSGVHDARCAVPWNTPPSHGTRPGVDLRTGSSVARGMHGPRDASIASRSSKRMRCGHRPVSREPGGSGAMCMRSSVCKGRSSRRWLFDDARYCVCAGRAGQKLPRACLCYGHGGAIASDLSYAVGGGPHKQRAIDAQRAILASTRPGATLGTVSYTHLTLPTKA